MHGRDDIPEGRENNEVTAMPQEDGFAAIEVDIGCCNEVWQALSELAGHISKTIKQCFSGIWNGIAWVFNIILKPIFISVVNVGGFFLEKFLLGSPGLHDYLQYGLWPSHVPSVWRGWVQDNSGWDIYETMGQDGDNVTGLLLGGGVGWLNLLNHYVTSLWRNIWNGSHLLGKNGIFGERHPITDQRNIIVKAIFGFLSLPVVLPVVIITNSFDAIGAVLKNLGYSFYRNLRSTNVLSENGVFGKRSAYEDDRHWSVRLVFGALTLPAVAPLALAANVFDFLVTGSWHFVNQFIHSFDRNLDCTFNIVLGKFGLFGERRKYKDKRHLALKIIFGALTLPFVAPFAVAINTVDLVMTGIWQFIKQTAWSIGRNLQRTFNIVLGDLGLFGERHLYKDERHWSVKIVFGTLTAPIVIPLALLTNSIDLVGAYFKHWRHTIVKPAIVSVSMIALTAFAIPTFVLRKTINGLYNLMLQPAVDCIQGRTPNGWSMMKGAANALTLGGFSVATKIFKLCTGYTHRFGFGYRNVTKDEDEEIVTNHFTDAQTRFRDAINLATKGKLPGVNDKMGYFRPVMRVIYGMRNKAEEILKAFHDEYLVYVDRKTLNGKNIKSLSLHSFFNRSEEKYTPVENRVKAKVNLQDDEEITLSAVKAYLLRV